MSNSVYVDTNIILSILLESEKYREAEELLVRFHKESLVTSGIAINEAFYVATFEYYKQRGLVKSKYSLRKKIKNKGYPNEVIRLIMGFIDDLNIKVLEDYYDLQEYVDIMTKYRLLPNDAQIALTCKHYGIETILTFDEDFKGIPWLKVIP